MVHKFFAFILLIVSFFYSATDTPFLPVASADIPFDGGGGGSHDTDGAPSSAADCAGGSSDCAGSDGACE